MTGACLCGGIRFRVTGPVSGVSFCHCSLCRRASGGAAVGQVLSRAADFTWEAGAELVRTFARPSGYESVFRQVCGSPAPELVHGGARARIPIVLLDGDPPLRVAEHIYVDSSASWEHEDAAPRYPGDGPPRDDLP